MIMDGKTLGVLGGMGPEATALFFNKVVQNTIAESDQEHINIMVLNHATIPDRTKLIKDNQAEEFFKSIKNDFDLFEKAAVNHLAIPCNTSHYYYEEMQAMTHIPIINMIDETVKELKKQYGSNNKIAILATDGTIQTNIYGKSCEKHKIDYHVPEDPIQEEVMGIIYSVKKGARVSPKRLERIIDTMLEVNKCSAVILGCTELSTLPINHSYKKKTIDPLEVLVHKSITLADKNSKLNFG